MPNVSECMAAIAVIAPSASLNVKPLDRLTVYKSNNRTNFIIENKTECNFESERDRKIGPTLNPRGRISCNTSILSGGSGLALPSCGASEKPDLYLEKKHFGTAIVIGSQSPFKWVV